MPKGDGAGNGWQFFFQLVFTQVIPSKRPEIRACLFVWRPWDKQLKRFLFWGELHGLPRFSLNCLRFDQARLSSWWSLVVAKQYRKVERGHFTFQVGANWVSKMTLTLEIYDFSCNGSGKFFLLFFFSFSSLFWTRGRVLGEGRRKLPGKKVSFFARQRYFPSHSKIPKLSFPLWK